jgi:large subunit ribosomal protein L23
MKIFELLLRPVITEKATGGEKEGKYQFIVREDATKIDIKKSFLKLYGVEAVKINVMHTPVKTKMGRTRQPVMKKHRFKKVIVTTKGRKTVDVLKPKLKV